MPGAERVETVLRATYALPAGRAQRLAEFLTANSTAEIDIRLEGERLTITAPEASQQAIGVFIETCLNREPAAAGPAQPIGSIREMNRGYAPAWESHPIPRRANFGPDPSDLLPPVDGVPEDQNDAIGSASRFEPPLSELDRSGPPPTAAPPESGFWSDADGAAVGPGPSADGRSPLADAFGRPLELPHDHSESP